MRAGRTYHKVLVFGVIVFATLFFQGCDTEGNIDPDYENSFVRFLGDEGNQEGVDMIVEEGDQSVILLGTTTVPGTEERRIFLVKADWEGNVIWKRKLGGPYDVAKDIERSNDGGFIILSETSPDVPNTNGLGVKLLTVSPDGSKADSVIFKSANGPSDFPSTVTPVSDGYLVTGSTQFGKQWADPDAEDAIDVLKIKFSNQLDVDPNYEHFYRAKNNIGYKTVQLGQSFFTFGSSSYSPGNNDNYNFICFATNDSGPTGNDFWMGSDETGDDEMLFSICPSFSPGYFMGGTFTNGTNTTDIFVGYCYEDNGILKKAGEGTVIKIPENAGRKITTNSVCQSNTNPRGYLILGTEGEEGFRNIWLSKISDIGTQVYWSSVFGSSDRNDDRAAAVAELPDGRVLVVGTVNLGVNNLKMSLFKLNSQGKFAN